MKIHCSAEQTSAAGIKLGNPIGVDEDLSALHFRHESEHRRGRISYGVPEHHIDDATYPGTIGSQKLKPDHAGNEDGRAIHAVEYTPSFPLAGPKNWLVAHTMWLWRQFVAGVRPWSHNRSLEPHATTTICQTCEPQRPAAIGMAVGWASNRV